MAEQIPLDMKPRPAFARDDFWVSPCNADAVAWLDKWPHWPSTALVITGDAASGKTHLARVFEQKSDAFYLCPEDMRTVPADARNVIVDDADKLVGRRDIEEMLFHLYNRLGENGGSMLLTATLPPMQWGFTVQDLKSRIVSSPHAVLGAPDDQLLAIMMTKLFSDRQIFVAQDVIVFVLSRIERSFSSVRNIVDAIDRKALADKRAVTIPLVKEVLQKKT